MSVKLQTEHYLEFLSLKRDCTGFLSLHLSKCHIVENQMLWLMHQFIYKIGVVSLPKKKSQNSGPFTRPQECVIENYFSYFLTKTYVVGTQKNSLNESDLLKRIVSMRLFF